jgi:hypothetical protein
MVLDFYALTIVAITCCVLFYVASADLQNYKIKNELVLLLAALYFMYVFATGSWNEVLSHIGVASLIFLMMLVCYSYGLLGGGDVKLLMVAFLWVGANFAFLFAVASERPHSGSRKAWPVPAQNLPRVALGTFGEFSSPSIPGNALDLCARDAGPIIVAVFAFGGLAGAGICRVAHAALRIGRRPRIQRLTLRWRRPGSRTLAGLKRAAAAVLRRIPLASHASCH